MQLFGTSIDVALGALHLRLSFALDDRTKEPATRVEDMPRMELSPRD